MVIAGNSAAVMARCMVVLAAMAQRESECRSSDALSASLALAVAGAADAGRCRRGADRADSPSADAGVR